MTSRDQLARQWAKYYSENWPEVRSTASPRSFFERAKAAVEFILDHTTPEPETMADVDWDDEKHYLAGCMSPYGSMVMLRPQGANMIVHDLNSDLTEVFDRDDLTPNGKRYELREVGAGEPDVRRARALVEELARDHNLHSLTDGKLARTMNEVLDALATPAPVGDTDAAQALADAGLLAPDLPEPRIDLGGWQEWGHKHGNRVTLENGMVTIEIPDDISRDLTPEEARDLAAWLNAAANHKEGA